MSEGHRPVSTNGVHVAPSRLAFTDSPFFRLLGQPLTSLEYLPAMSSNRNTVRKTLSLSTEHTNMIRENKTYRIMLYCAVDDATSPMSKRDIAFPSQIEVKVNGDLYQGNLRGIKKKSGTTRPADITNLVRKMPHYGNEIAITYAATDRVHFPNAAVGCWPNRYAHGANLNVRDMVLSSIWCASTLWRSSWSASRKATSSPLSRSSTRVGCMQ